MSIRCALISVSDKTGLADFARALSERSITILSTGGTLQSLQGLGLSIVGVDQYTESPELMGGRVKTLHPRVHGGILGREGTDDGDLARIGGRYIDLVVVNLYPFEQTLARPDTSNAELIENIDIGGPSMLRSAAKNFNRVTVICDPADYGMILRELNQHGEVPLATRERLAAKAFAHTAAYDAAISGWFSAIGEADGYSRSLSLVLEKAYGLRYGENPHQSAAFYRERQAPAGSMALAASLGSGAKELSFNNLVDCEAALDAVREFNGPTAVVVKHASPCGIASASNLAAAYEAARDADAMSAFGGIVALNRPVDDATAALLLETFLECIIAPEFEHAALDRLRKKPSLRLLAVGVAPDGTRRGRQFKRIGGGFVVQSRDEGAATEVTHGRVVTRRSPTEAELRALEFAWCACKHVRSNAIVLARALDDSALCATTGIGGGQTARVSAVKIACENASARSVGSVLASDAYFPFPDGLELAAAAGVTAVAQPGGSKNDADVIAAADAAGLVMVFTGVRHFRH